jgi:hypothetical protein
MPNFRACYLGGLITNACDALGILSTRSDDPPLDALEAREIAGTFLAAAAVSGHRCEDREGCYGHRQDPRPWTTD